jgi:hypothetical protein
MKKTLEEKLKSITINDFSTVGGMYQVLGLINEAAEELSKLRKKDNVRDKT